MELRLTGGGNSPALRSRWVVREVCQEQHTDPQIRGRSCAWLQAGRRRKPLLRK